MYLPRKSFFDFSVFLCLIFSIGYWFFQFFLIFGAYVDIFLSIFLLFFSLFNTFYNEFIKPLLPEDNNMESFITLSSIFAVIVPKNKIKENYYPLVGLTWQRRGLFGSAAVRSVQAKIGEATLGTLIASGVAITGTVISAYGVKRNNDILESNLKVQQDQAEKQIKAQQEQTEVLKKQAEEQIRAQQEQNILNAELELAKLEDSWSISSNFNQKEILKKRIEILKNRDFIEKTTIENKLEIKVPEINSCFEEKYIIWDIFISFIKFLKNLFF